MSEDENIIPDWLFEEQKMDFYVRIPFSPKNEEISRTFVKKLDEYTDSKYVFKIIWNTRNIRSLFPLKDRVDHRSCVIYQGTCSCGEDYIGETIRIADIRWGSIPIQHPQRSLPTQHATSSRTQHTSSYGKSLRMHLDKI